MANYTSKANIENYLGRSLSSKENSYLTVLLPAVDDFIDRYTGRTFSTGDEQTKYYDGEGDKYLSIDLFSAIDSVDLVDWSGGSADSYESLTDETDFVKYPLNDTVYNMLYRRAGGWLRGHKNVKIVCTVAEEAVPDGIIHAATQLAAGYLDSQKNLKKETIEGYSREFDLSVQDNTELTNALDQYKELSI